MKVKEVYYRGKVRVHDRGAVVSQTPEILALFPTSLVGAARLISTNGQRCSRQRCNTLLSRQNGMGRWDAPASFSTAIACFAR